MEYELKLLDGSVVTWTGENGIDAAQRYVAAHPEAAVVAWREANRHGLHFGGKKVVIAG